MFSKNGFEATSTRALAQKAQVNLAAITYYFGDKMDLYNAVIDSVVEQIKELNAKNAKLLKDLADMQHKTAAEALAILHKMMENVVDFACGNKAAPEIVEILAKEMASPSPAYAKVYNEIALPFYKTTAELVAKIVGAASESLQTNIIAHSILGQLMIFRTHKETFLRYAGLKKYNAHFIEQIKKTIVTQTDAILQTYQNTKTFGLPLSDGVDQG